jgi:hypothetical protein
MKEGERCVASGMFGGERMLMENAKEGEHLVDVAEMGKNTNESKKWDGLEWT